MSNDASDILDRLTRVMAGYRPQWLLCGGWAVDAWAGRQTRDHLDVDIAVFQEDLAVLFEHLAAWSLVGHDPNVPDDTTEPWNGRRLDLPAHIHSNSPEMNGTELDIQVNARAGGEWICREDPRLATSLRDLPVPGCGLPTAPPEVVLYYKAGSSREHDAQDFRTLLPVLTGPQRAWLRAAIGPAHPWCPHLA